MNRVFKLLWVTLGVIIAGFNVSFGQSKLEMKNVTLRSKDQIEWKNSDNVQIPSNSKWDDTTQKHWTDLCREVGIPSSLDEETQMAYFYASKKKGQAFGCQFAYMEW